MAELRKMKCDYPGCDKEETEVMYGHGFQGWGAVHGIQNKETGQVSAHLCPVHLNKVKKFIFGE